MTTPITGPPPTTHTNGAASTAAPPAGGKPVLRATFSYEAPASLLMPSPDYRDRNSPDYLDYLHNVLRPDIHRRGVQVTLIAFLDNGKKRLLDGGTRLQAALLEHLEEVPVLCYPAKPSEAELRIATFLANENRKDWTPAERGRFYLETMRKERWTQAEMSRNIAGLKASRVSKTLKWLTNIPPEFHDKVGEGEGMIPERGAYTISCFPEEERRSLCERFLAGKMTVEELDGQRKAAGGSKPQRKKKPRKISHGGVEATFKSDLLANKDALLAEWKGFRAKMDQAIKRVESGEDVAKAFADLLK